jgi:FtsH-binding integral membrane protein
MALTVVGVFLGIAAAPFLLSSGMHILLLFLELGIVATAAIWQRRAPLNMILFALFPLLSGITVTPYILMILMSYVNGTAILLNALLATTFMALAAAVFARTTKIPLAGFGQILLLGLLGLIAMGLLQLFVPALRGTQIEVLLSGFSILLFSGFLSVDLQRITARGAVGESPFLLALSLYLDVFNLFIAIVRFMAATSGRRR